MIRVVATVKTHVNNLFAKLGVNSRSASAELVRGPQSRTVRPEPADSAAAARIAVTAAPKRTSSAG